MSLEPLFDVLAVSLTTSEVRLLETNCTRRNADAISEMAVRRRGVEEEFFVVCEAGKYLEGDTYGV